MTCQGADEPASGLLIAIADAVQRFDGIKLIIDFTKLLAQSLDVAVDRPVIHIDLIIIGHVHQLVARLHETGALRESLQQQELH